ncbi:guanine nucleotide-binding protein G(i) subunit alpha [Acrasis kona]|uniref:Guanine nucleotide-binding protein G(I) subunit alpha n=1 Tax=Acrasis kona TaxID=1008807 RepID=A0AAW2Z7B4_9EUKA
MTKGKSGMFKSINGGDIFDDFSKKPPVVDKVEPKPLEPKVDAGSKSDAKAHPKRGMMNSMANVDILEDISHVSFRRKDLTPARLEPIRVLFAGAENCGKSTLRRHIKSIEGKAAYTLNECANTMPEIRKFIIANLRSFVNDYDRIRAAYTLDENLKTALYIMERTDSKNYQWDEEFTNRVVKLWEDKNVQRTWEQKRHEFNINDSAPYFFQNATKYNENNYSASQEDMFRFRVEGPDNVNEKLVIKDRDVILMEREKTNYMLEDSHTAAADQLDIMIYVISLSDFDQKVDKRTTMADAMEAFERDVQSPYLLGCSVIVVFNKIDILAEKIKTKDLWATFPEYSAGNDFEKAKDYITKEFINKSNDNPIKSILYTSSIDNKSVTETWEEIKKVILEKAKRKEIMQM